MITLWMNFYLNALIMRVWVMYDHLTTWNYIFSLVNFVQICVFCEHLFFCGFFSILSATLNQCDGKNFTLLWFWFWFWLESFPRFPCKCHFKSKAGIKINNAYYQVNTCKGVDQSWLCHKYVLQQISKYFSEQVQFELLLFVYALNFNVIFYYCFSISVFHVLAACQY
jgi:hypothetical protein